MGVVEPPFISYINSMRLLTIAQGGKGVTRVVQRTMHHLH